MLTSGKITIMNGDKQTLDGELMEKNKATKESESPEPYDKEGWEQSKRAGAAFAIQKGRELGVPLEVLNQFALEKIEEEKEKGHYGFAYRFRKNMGIGTDEELKAAGVEAYNRFFNDGDFGAAMKMAEEVYGKNSPEWERANRAKNEKVKETEKRTNGEEGIRNEDQDLQVVLSRDATFADLFKALDAIEPDEEGELDATHFYEGLWEKFDPEFVKEVLSFEDTRISRAATTKVIDFFREHGYSQSDISVFLPIKFKRKRSRKQ